LAFATYLVWRLRIGAAALALVLLALMTATPQFTPVTTQESVHEARVRVPHLIKRRASRYGSHISFFLFTLV